MALANQTQRFTVTDEHLKLLKAMNVEWNGAEWGAPSIDPKRPYGGGGLRQSMWQVLGGFGYDDWDQNHDLPKDVTPMQWDAMVERYDKLHREMETVLQIFLRVGVAGPGLYEAGEYRTDWRAVGDKA
jgi:hypothetical protein